MSRVLLDTSAYSAFMLGMPAAKSCLQAAEAIFLNPVVLGELLAGFRKGMHCATNEKELSTLLSSPRVGVLDMTEDTAHRYAFIHDSLRKAGPPIPTHDLWITATAMQHGLVVVTSDDHFLKIQQIATELVDLRA
ncbi:MAG: type II toxin-antitoxin system VapC family toxin [Nitrospirae bacterium]|nr:type II toxin-antitoxin system VapC family toxin [Nitrospirota bacterium]